MRLKDQLQNRPIRIVHRKGVFSGFDKYWIDALTYKCWWIKVEYAGTEEELKLKIAGRLDMENREEMNESFLVVLNEYSNVREYLDEK